MTKKKYPKFIVLSFAPFLLLLAVSCKKETIIKEVPLKHSWLLDSSLFGYDKLLLTSQPLNDSELIVASGTVLWYINANKLNKSINGNFYTFMPIYGYLNPPSLSSYMGIYAVDSNYLKIFPVRRPNAYPGTVVFTPSYSSSSVSVKGLSLGLPRSQSYPIINSYSLFPVEIDYTAKQATCNLLKFDFIKQGSEIEEVSLVSKKEINITAEPSTIGFELSGYMSAAYFGKFFLSYQSQFYRIDTLGNVKSFGNNPVKGSYGVVGQMFTLGNLLFASGASTIWVSQDQGENWSVFSDQITMPYNILSFLNVNKELYAYYQSQIVKITLSGNTLVTTELDNDGLETNQITSICKVGKTVFITTLSGLYYRPADEFDTPKK